MPEPRQCKYGCGTMIEFVGTYPNGKPYECDNMDIQHTPDRCKSLKAGGVTTRDVDKPRDTSKPYRKQGTPLDLAETNEKLQGLFSLNQALQSAIIEVRNLLEAVLKKQGLFETASDMKPQSDVEDMQPQGIDDHIEDQLNEMDKST